MSLKLLLLWSCNNAIGGGMPWKKICIIGGLGILLNFLVFCASDQTPTDKAFPDAPSGLYGGAVSSSEVQLSWVDNSNNESGFEIYRGPNWSRVGTTGANNTLYLDSILEDSTFYSYYVTAINRYGKSATSETVTVATFSIGSPPDVPSNPIPFNGADVAADTVLLRWESGDIDGDSIKYDIYFDTTNPPHWAASDLNINTYNPGALRVNITYYWFVVAKDTHKHQSEGPIWYFRTVPPKK
jgi:hypothetical protein